MACFFCQLENAVGWGVTPPKNNNYKKPFRQPENYFVRFGGVLPLWWVENPPYGDFFPVTHS